MKRLCGAETMLRASEAVVPLVQAKAQYQSAQRVMLYYPLWDEPDTRPLITAALEAGKRVILPTVVGDDIVPVEVTRDTVWTKGAFGIMEPDAKPYDGPIDFILVPGVAFDGHNNRLGRGRGYYDRFLADHIDAFRLGICFDYQKIPNVPVEHFDLAMHSLVTIPTPGFVY